MIISNDPVQDLSPGNEVSEVQSWYDPQVEFLEVGVWNNGDFSTKTYGPDASGIYGGMQGVGGLESVSASGHLSETRFVQDYFGNVIGTIANGAVAWNPTRFSSYGPVQGYQQPALSLGVDLPESLGYRGKRVDETGFVYLGARMYDPVSGHFLSADPLGHSASQDLYSFCGGDPINSFDPDGRCGDFALGAATVAARPGTWATTEEVGDAMRMLNQPSYQGPNLTTPIIGAPTLGMIGLLLTPTTFGPEPDMTVYPSTQPQQGFVLGEGQSRDQEGTIRDRSGAPVRDQNNPLNPINFENRDWQPDQPGLRLPKNGSWSGTPGNSLFYPNNPQVLAITGDNPIRWIQGRPDFRPWSVLPLQFEPGELSGLHTLDIPTILEAIQQEKDFDTRSQALQWLNQNNLTPHHSFGDTVEIIPRPLNDLLRHTGGAYDLRNPPAP
jgi:RHS repeat-associated protein